MARRTRIARQHADSPGGQRAPGDETPVLNMTGRRIALGPLRRDLLPLYHRWINDFEVAHTLKQMRPMTMQAEEAWYEGASKSTDSYGFTMYLRAGLRPIGSCGLHHIDHRNRCAEFGIVIGEKSCWNKGYGTEAAVMVLDFGFHALDLHNIRLRVHSNNPRGVRSYEKAGFKPAGRLRQAHRVGGRTFDVVYMDCLASEFKRSALTKIVESQLRRNAQRA